jgi:hypothetical protein
MDTIGVLGREADFLTKPIDQVNMLIIIYRALCIFFALLVVWGFLWSGSTWAFVLKVPIAIVLFLAGLSSYATAESEETRIAFYVLIGLSIVSNLFQFGQTIYEDDLDGFLLFYRIGILSTTIIYLTILMQIGNHKVKHDM